jgi:hypothetical protein
LQLVHLKEEDCVWTPATANVQSKQPEIILVHVVQIPLLFIGVVVGQLSKQDPADKTEGLTQLVQINILVELNEQTLQLSGHN